MKKTFGNRSTGNPKPLTAPQDEKERRELGAKRTWCDIVRVMSLLWLGLAGIGLLFAGGVSLFLLWFLNWESAAGSVLVVAGRFLFYVLFPFSAFLVAGPWMVRRQQVTGLGLSRTQTFLCNLRMGLPYWIAVSTSSGCFWFAARHIGPATPRTALLTVAWVAFGLALLVFVLCALFNVFDKRST